MTIINIFSSWPKRIYKKTVHKLYCNAENAYLTQQLHEYVQYSHLSMILLLCHCIIITWCIQFVVFKSGQLQDFPRNDGCIFETGLLKF